MFAYASCYTQRVLYDQAPELEQEQREPRPRRAGKRTPRTLAWRRQERNGKVRAERLATRAREGYAAEVEASCVPFRGFTALNNLEAGPRLVQRDRALDRVAAENRRAKARSRGVQGGGCRPEQCPSGEDLHKQRSTLSQAKLERIDRELRRSFLVANGKRVCDDPPQGQVEPNRPTPSARFNGLFPPVLPAQPAKPEAPPCPQPGRMNNTRVQARFTSAAKHNNVEEMKLLVRKHLGGPALQLDGLDADGQNAMHAAASALQLDALEYLVLRGARRDIMSEAGLTPEQILQLRRASDKRADVRPLLAVLGDASIFAAAQAADVHRLKWLLRSGLGTHDQRNAHGLTPLHYAFLSESHEAVEALLEAGASSDALNPLGQRASDMGSEEFAAEVEEHRRARDQIRHEIAEREARQEAENNEIGDIDYV